VPTEPPVVLAIECSNPGLGAGVALGRVAASVAVETLASVDLPEDRSASEALAPAIEAARRAAGLDPGDLGAVAVSAGPGGYSGTRVSVAMAKAIAESVGRLRGRPVACYGVPTARVAWLGVAAAARSAGPVAVALGWKRESAWLTRFDPSGRTPGGALVGLADMTLSPAETLVAEEAVADRLATVGAVNDRAAVAPPRLGAAAVMEACVWEAPTDALSLLPLYPREPEAVTKWRDRGAR
jgi:tRNA threonylcarbamoyl adenosine modification protein YeaZ